jgi:hypothetical protein
MGVREYYVGIVQSRTDWTFSGRNPRPCLEIPTVVMIEVKLTPNPWTANVARSRSGLSASGKITVDRSRVLTSAFCPGIGLVQIKFKLKLAHFDLLGANVCTVGLESQQ